MAEVYHEFYPEEAMLRSTAFPAIVQANGSNYPVRGMAFATDATEAIFFKFRAVNYGSGNLTIDIDWYADTASANDVVWDAQIACITPNTDTQDIETDALATANTVTDSHLGTTGQRLHRATITLSNTDSIAADDYCTLRIARDIGDAADDMAGDAIVVLITVSYSDT